MPTTTISTSKGLLITAAIRLKMLDCFKDMASKPTIRALVSSRSFHYPSSHSRELYRKESVGQTLFNLSLAKN
jgi:hypothetical protein